MRKHIIKMSTTTTTTTTTTRDRGDRYGPIEWAQLYVSALHAATVRINWNASDSFYNHTWGSVVSFPHKNRKGEWMLRKRSRNIDIAVFRFIVVADTLLTRRLTEWSSVSCSRQASLVINYSAPVFVAVCACVQHSERHAEASRENGRGHLRKNLQPETRYAPIPLLFCWRSSS